ncbi:MAG: Mrp/NBP35 family ATP-binding protein [Spirochaetales bacterium]|nr:Mrp/NBP35 family ATP-binding protein [Spirochaetales bacterium]
MHGPQGAALEVQNKRLQERMSSITYKILIMSGKGGVGKTTISINLAQALSMKGYRVGILDTDLHGPNIAKMLGVQGERLYSSDENTIEPLEILTSLKEGKPLKVVSLALSGNDEDEPVIWRGPIKISVIKQFLADVNWGSLDFLIIDSPPGTGDEPLTVVQSLPDLSGSIVVTTPQEVAVLDSRKSINFAKKTDTRLLGVVENMSGYVCPHCGETVDLFGKGGGEKAAKEMQVPFLGSIPLEKVLMQSGDAGKLFLKEFPESGSARAIMDIAEKVLDNLNEKNG